MENRVRRHKREKQHKEKYQKEIEDLERRVISYREKQERKDLYQTEEIERLRHAEIQVLKELKTLYWNLKDEREQQKIIAEVLLSRKQNFLKSVSGEISQYEMERRRITLERNIPEEILKEFVEEPFEEYQSIIWRQRKKQIRENGVLFAIEKGISHLNTVFERIKEETGQEVRGILYADSGSRPLRYAVQPLIQNRLKRESQEDEEGIRQPKEFFVKPFRFEGEHWVLEEDLDYQREQEKGWEIERKNLIAQLKREKNRIEKRRLQEEIHRIYEKIKEGKERIGKINTMRDIQEKGLQEEIIKNRISEILAQVPEGPLLIVDDVVVSGRTINGLLDAFEKLGRKDDVYIFAFVGDFPNELNLEQSHQFYGTGYIDEENNVLENQIGTKLDEQATESSIRSGIDDIYGGGFPYKGMENKLGVVKREYSLHPYVEVSEEGDAKEKRAIRATYRQLGEAAVEKLRIEKM